jgi:hypothetical protein
MEKIYTVLVRTRSSVLQKLANSGHLEDVHVYDYVEVEYQSLDYNKALQFYNDVNDFTNDYGFFVAKYLVHSRLESILEDGIINEDTIKMYVPRGL